MLKPDRRELDYREFVEARVFRTATLEAVDAALTPREAAALRLVAAGRTDREIADVLGLTPNATARHLRNARKKLNAANRVEAAATALRFGLL